jgi:hypothetical protein
MRNLYSTMLRSKAFHLVPVGRSRRRSSAPRRGPRICRVEDSYLTRIHRL